MDRPRFSGGFFVGRGVASCRCRLWGVRHGSKDTLLLAPLGVIGEQIGSMSEPSPPGRYRVRPADQNETTVPSEVIGPTFDHRDEAERYAHSLVITHQAPVVVEKLAPAGCWLQLRIIG